MLNKALRGLVDSIAIAKDATLEQLETVLFAIENGGDADVIDEFETDNRRLHPLTIKIYFKGGGYREVFRFVNPETNVSVITVTSMSKEMLNRIIEEGKAAEKKRGAK